MSKIGKIEAEEVNEVYCIMCGKSKGSINFYTTYNPIIKSGKIHICKSCMSDFVIGKDGSVNIDKFRYILRMVDAPFYKNLYDTAFDGKGDNLIGKYFSYINLHQNRGKTYKDSDLDITDDILNLRIKFIDMQKQMEEMGKKINFVSKR